MLYSALPSSSSGCTGTDGRSGTNDGEFLWDTLGIRDIGHNEAGHAGHYRDRLTAGPLPKASGQIVAGAAVLWNAANKAGGAGRWQQRHHV
jgi:hypothetical protein